MKNGILGEDIGGRSAIRLFFPAKHWAMTVVWEINCKG